MEVYFAFPDLVEYVNELDSTTHVKVGRTLEALQKYGSEIGMPYSKMIDKNLFELRTQGKKRVRILYAFHQDMAVILLIFVKKTKKIPIREIELAKTRKRDLGIK
ncbi:MAG: type II toxin-antitoxin system RelE/ParE family toxin [Patescibacteria group bacterium]